MLDSVSHACEWDVVGCERVHRWCSSPSSKVERRSPNVEMKGGVNIAGDPRTNLMRRILDVESSF
jgi:hypothetical protein